MANEFSIVTAGEGASATREMMITYLNTGTADAPVWSPMGAKVNDSNIDYDWNIDTGMDVLGNAYTDAKTAKMSQTFSGSEIIAGNAVMNQLIDLAVVKKNPALLTKQDCLIVHTYLQNEAGAAFAERYPATSVIPTTIGGEGGGALVTDISVNYGGVREVGTATVADGVVTYTKKAA